MKEKEPIGIKRIIIEVAGLNVSLTPEEVIKLRDELNKLYPPQPIYVYPQQYWPNWTWPTWTPTITCISGGNAV